MQMETGMETTRLVEQLRSCCEIMWAAPPDTLSRLSLTVRLDGTSGSALSTLRLAERIAEEYCLRAMVHVEGRGLTVRLSRHDSQVP